MIRIRKILVPTDFSEPAAKALQYAEALGAAHGAELLLVHAIPPQVYPAEGIQVSRAIAEIQEELEQAATRNLEEMAEGVGEGLSVRSRVVNGVPFLEIIRMAREEDVDLIVIATHGYTGLKHVFLGSVAEKVVRKAPCPVLTVKEREREFVAP